MGYATGGMLFFQLWTQNRVSEAKAVCERVIAECPILSLRNHARRNLCELYFHHIGDGPAIREVALAGIKELESYPKELNNPKLKKVYGDLCDYMRDVSISFDEYKEYKLKKWKYIPPSKEDETRLQITENDIKNKGIPWLEQIMYHAGDYWEHNAFSQNAVYLSLVLEYRKELKVGKEDLNVHTLPLYSMAIVNIIANHTSACSDRGQAVIYDNYAFIAERAMERIEACKESRLTDESVADKSIEALKGILFSLKKTIQELQASGRGGGIPHPTAQEIRDAFEKVDSRRPPGCLLPIIFIIVFVIVNTISTNITAKGTEDAPPLTSYTQLVNDGGITVSAETTAAGIRVDGEYMAEKRSFLSKILYLKLYYTELDGKVIPIVYYNQFGKTPKITMKGNVLEIDSNPSIKEAVDELREKLPDAEFGDYAIVPDF